MKKLNDDKKYERILCYHPESDSLFLVFSQQEFTENFYSAGGIDDVTGFEEFEKRFREEFRAEDYL